MIKVEPDLELGVQQQKGPIGRSTCVAAGTSSRPANSSLLMRFNSAGRLNLETNARTQWPTALAPNDFPAPVDVIVIGASQDKAPSKCSATLGALT